METNYHLLRCQKNHRTCLKITADSMIHFAPLLALAIAPHTNSNAVNEKEPEPPLGALHAVGDWLYCVMVEIPSRCTRSF